MQKGAFSLLILIIIGFSIGTISAGTMNKPYVPEFSLKLVHYIYDQPAVYGIDPYTGENVTITPAKHQGSTEIVITIKNQPFTPYKDADGNWIDLAYVVRSKGHFSDNWSESGLKRDPNNDSYTVASHSASYYPENAQIDFQVKAMIGYCKDTGLPSIYNIAPVFYGESSDWSDIQTITITNTSSTPNTSPIPSSVIQTPSGSSPRTAEMPQQSKVEASMFLDLISASIIALLSVVVVLLVFVVVHLRRRSASSPVGVVEP